MSDINIQEKGSVEDNLSMSSDLSGNVGYIRSGDHIIVVDILKRGHKEKYEACNDNKDHKGSNLDVARYNMKKYRVKRILNYDGQNTNLKRIRDLFHRQVVYTIDKVYKNDTSDPHDSTNYYFKTIQGAQEYGEPPPEYTGYLSLRHPNGIIKSCGIYDIGERDGIWTEYDNKGNMIRESVYKNGLLHGREISWQREGGVKRVEGKYVNGHREGRWVSYFQDGSISVEWKYKKGRVHGKYNSYHEEVKKGVRVKKEEGTYVDGKVHGVWTRWYKNGKIDEEMEYEKGELHGQYTSWTETGHADEKGIYHEGYKHGKWEQWSNENRKRKKTYWEHGIKLYWIDHMYEKMVNKCIGITYMH